MRKIYLLLLASLSIARFANAQGCTLCAEALRHGTTDVFSTEKHAQLNESVAVMYSKDYTFWENYATTSNQSTDLGASYSIYSATYKSISNQTLRKDTYTHDQQSYQMTSSLSQNQFEAISQTLVDKTPYNTFLACVRSQCDNGITLDSKSTGDLVIIYITFKINVGNLTQKAVMLASPTVANARPIDNHFVKGMTLSNPNTVSSVYQRIDPQQPVVFSCSFQGFPSTPLTIKAGPSGNSLMPVGTIVASDLDFSTFCVLNNLARTNDMSEQVWVPADGRTVAGSAYSKFKPNVPDLRGTFLRGLNVFDHTLNPPFQHLEQKDPDDREVGAFQKGSVESHNHTLTDPGHLHPIALHRTDGAGGIGASGYDGHPILPVDHASETAKTNITLAPYGGAETRPSNVAIYYYIKIN